MIELILQVLFPIFIILYWFSEGVSEGWTWANKTRQKNFQSISASKYILIFKLQHTTEENWITTCYSYVFDQIKLI